MYGELIFDVKVTLDGRTREIFISGWKPPYRGGAVSAEGTVEGDADYLTRHRVPEPTFTDHDAATTKEIRRMKAEMQECFEEECRVEDCFNESPASA
jgi:hypothetical protein